MQCAVRVLTRLLRGGHVSFGVELILSRIIVNTERAEAIMASATRGDNNAWLLAVARRYKAAHLREGKCVYKAMEKIVKRKSAPVVGGIGAPVVAGGGCCGTGCGRCGTGCGHCGTGRGRCGTVCGRGHEQLWQPVAASRTD